MSSVGMHVLFTKAMKEVKAVNTKKQPRAGGARLPNTKSECQARCKPSPKTYEIGIVKIAVVVATIDRIEPEMAPFWRRRSRVLQVAIFHGNLPTLEIDLKWLSMGYLDSSRPYDSAPLYISCMASSVLRGTAKDLIYIWHGSFRY